MLWERGGLPAGAVLACPVTLVAIGSPGSQSPCWYDPEDAASVVLTRGPGGAYLFALLPLPLLAFGLWRIRSGFRR